MGFLTILSQLLHNLPEQHLVNAPVTNYSHIKHNDTMSCSQMKCLES